jgi:hypothetical protein
MGAIPGMSIVATKMMRKKIDGAGIPNLEELMDVAQIEGVKFIACKMTIDMMGLSEDDFIEGVEIQTAEDYLKHARNCKINMFTREPFGEPLAMRKTQRRRVIGYKKGAFHRNAPFYQPAYLSVEGGAGFIDLRNLERSFTS